MLWDWSFFLNIYSKLVYYVQSMVQCLKSAGVKMRSKKYQFHSAFCSPCILQKAFGAQVYFDCVIQACSVCGKYISDILATACLGALKLPCGYTKSSPLNQFSRPEEKKFKCKRFMPWNMFLLKISKGFTTIKVLL